MIVFEITDDKFGKIMKSISEIGKHKECLEAMFEDLAEESEIGKHSECLAAIFEDLAEDSEHSEYENRKRYDDDDMYGSRYGMRRGGRRVY